MGRDKEFEKRVEELARLPASQYDRKRKKAADELGVRVSTLDEKVETQRKRNAKSEDDFSFETVAPWPKAVDGALLLGRISRFYRRFIVLTRFEADAAALWTLYSYCYDAFETSPLLAIESATKRCGKTTLLKVAGALVRHAISTSNVSPAALFRFIDKCRPTMLLDEADTWLRGNDDARSVLNSGHTRANATVIRCDGDDMTPKRFSTWCPKMVALIGRLDDTLQDRSIVILLRRRRSTEKVEEYRHDRPPPEVNEFRRQCVRWARENFAALRGWDPIMPDGLNDRARDNWRPLVAIAELAERSISQESFADVMLSMHARSAACELSGFDREVPEITELLLADIDGGFRELHVVRLRSQELVDFLVGQTDRPWSEWSRGRPMTSNQLARKLEPLGIRPIKIRFGQATARGYEHQQFAAALSVYPPPQSGTVEQATLFNGLGAIQTGTEGQHVPVVNAGNPMNAKECSSVPVGKGGNTGEGQLADCGFCRNFKRISDETGECTEHHGDAAPGSPRICRDYLPASSENDGDGRDGAPGNGLDAGDRETKITH